MRFVYTLWKNFAIPAIFSFIFDTFPAFFLCNFAIKSVVFVRARQSLFFEKVNNQLDVRRRIRYNKSKS